MALNPLAVKMETSVYLKILSLTEAELRSVEEVFGELYVIVVISHHRMLMSFAGL